LAAAAFAAGVLLAAAVPSALALPGDRTWEMVSPVEKNGGEIRGAEEVLGGGVFQAAADGDAITYSSTASFSGAPAGAPPASQYVSSRGEAGWSTQSLDVGIFSGSYGLDPDGVPYQLFSSDLARGLLLSGVHCRAQAAGCPVANPPLAGTGAPPGYQNYYLRSGSGFEALIGPADVANTTLSPADFEVRFAGASPDLSQVILETCAALTANATEVPLGEGCDPAEANLYRWAAGSLSLVNSVPGATLAAQLGAVSADGSRVYFNDSEGGLYLRDGGQEKEVFAGNGGEPARLQGTSPDGSVAYFTIAGGVFQYTTASEAFTFLTELFTVQGVLAVSPSGNRIYYLANDGLYTWANGTATKVAASADPSNLQAATGTARVSADGNRLLFVSSAKLTSYNNTDQKTGQPDAEIYLYNAGGSGALRCISCRQSGLRPVGPSTVPGASANGDGDGVTNSYKPRAFSADGNRVFFDSRDVLTADDVNSKADVYMWTYPFARGCLKAAGCIDLISSGQVGAEASFLDASRDGDDAFFVTNASLTGSDFGGFDLYDARVSPGVPEEVLPITCEGDACQDLPSEPIDPALNTRVPGLGNPKTRYFKYPRRPESCKGARAKRTTKCKKQAKRAAKKRGKRKRGGR
jgi:hypothetical protein